MIVIAAYDISEDGRRSKVAAILQAWGDRVQKSVFVLDVDEAGLSRVRAKTTAIMDLACDSLYLFRQCAGCWDRIECIGQAARPEKVLYWSAL